VRSESGEEGASAFGDERASGEQTRGKQAGEAEPGEHERVVRDLDERSERVRREVGPVLDQLRDQAAPGAAIRAEAACGLVERAAEHDRRAVV